MAASGKGLKLPLEGVTEVSSERASDPSLTACETDAGRVCGQHLRREAWFRKGAVSHPCENRRGQHGSGQGAVEVTGLLSMDHQEYEVPIPESGGHA